jgi:hypothetical protein
VWVFAGAVAGGCDDVKIDAQKGRPAKGVVRDADTGQPVAGAFVTFEWWETVSARVDTGSHCFHAEVRRSAADGSVEVPVHMGYLPSGVVVYARGYERPPLGYGGQNEFALKRARADREARLQHLFGLVTNCRGEDSARALAEVERAMLEELHELAVTDKEKEMVRQRALSRPAAGQR